MSHEDASGIELALANLSTEWADSHQPIPFGPAIYVLDVQQIRVDLDVGSIGSADEYTRKKDLFLTILLNTQGLSFFPPSLKPATKGFFEKWGWDMADVGYSLYLPDEQTSIIQALYDTALVRSRLQEEGFVEEEIPNGSTKFSSGDSTLKFILKPQMIIVQENGQPDEIDTFARMSVSGPRLPEHPAMAALLPELEGQWGAVFSLSADMETLLSERDAVLSQQFPQIDLAVFYAMLGVTDGPTRQWTTPWDLMAIGFSGVDETKLTFAYHFLSAEAASRAADFVKILLTESPALITRGKVWGDFMTLSSIEVNDGVVVALAKTPAKELIGNALLHRDYYAFLPYRFE